MKTIWQNFYRKIIFNASALKAGKHNNVCCERYVVYRLNTQTTVILSYTY
jgi:hypothetical protein